MNSVKSARYALVLFVVFLLIQIGLVGMAYMEWVSFDQQEGMDWNMHFAVGVFLGLGAIITFVLIYAQAVMSAREAADEEKSLRLYQNAQLVRNIIGLIPAVATYAGMIMTGYWPFFIIGGVSILIQLAYWPTHGRLKRELRLK